MEFTGLSDFLLYGLLFVAIVGFNLFKQFTNARRETARRKTQLAQNQQAAGRPEPMEEPMQVPDTHEVDLQEEHWGRPPEPVPETMPMGLPESAQPMEVVLAREKHEQSHDDYSSKPAQAPGRRAPSRRSGSGHRLFRHRGDLRHGIVLMTVLGPCRASQPYDQDRH